MNYFTPELYLRYNSADDDEADRADEAWEAAIIDYRNHLDSIRPLMPPRVRWLATDASLHDAELLALQADPIDPESEMSASPLAATISLKQGEQIIHLDYLLWGPLVQTPPPSPWPFSSSRVHWLYDEFDDVSGRFWHRILLSDGRTLAIPFLDVIASRFSPDRPEPALVARSRS